MGSSEPVEYEPLDFQEAAEKWRRKAEAFHRLSQRHERLASSYRRRADHAEAMSRYFSGTGKWPRPPKM